MSEAVKSELSCPRCGGPCTEASEDTELLYGVDEAVVIPVTHIVITCDDATCGERFSDCRGEEARETKVDAYKHAFADPYRRALRRYLPFAQAHLQAQVVPEGQAAERLEDLKRIEAMLAALIDDDGAPKEFTSDLVYEVTMMRIDELMVVDPEPQTPKGIELATLVTLAQFYERDLLPVGLGLE
jgi:hypothetical protein